MTTYAGISSSMRGEAAAHSASALANKTLLIKLPPTNLAAILLLKPVKKTISNVSTFRYSVLEKP